MNTLGSRSTLAPAGNACRSRHARSRAPTYCAALCLVIAKLRASEV